MELYRNDKIKIVGVLVILVGLVFDPIVILNRGILIKTGLLLNWENDDVFALANGKPAALGFLYYYLVQYSSTFVGRSLNISGYFELINRWNANNI